MRVHHFGYIVKSLPTSLDGFRRLGFSMCPSPLDGIVRDDYREIDIAFIEKDGYCIELIAPIDKNSKMYPMLKKHRNNSYHICYESDDMDADIASLEQDGWHIIDPLAPAPAIEGRNVCFLLHPNVGMIELLDSSAN